jgi:3-oxoacyl-[acyl-carrier-protein] synthase II
MRRVVVTGRGIVSPLGKGISLVWENLIQGRSGIKAIDTFDTTDFPCKIAGLVPRGQASGELDPDTIMSSKEQRKIDDFILYAIAAADEALKDANWHPTEENDREKTGVCVGSGIGGLPEIYNTSIILKEKGSRRVSPFFIPACLINLASGQISIRHQLKGPNLSHVTACATGTHAIGEAARLIACNDADVMVAGGAEASVCPIGIAGFAALKALSTQFNDRPQEASRPWDRDRDGFVMGEGAGVLVLESLEHAQKRGAPIYAEIVGYGLSGDAYHIAALDREGSGPYRAMQQAIKKASICATDIGYINAHGTSTPMGDGIELKAIERLMEGNTSQLSVSSTKSATGHLLGAAGGIEAIFAMEALRTGMIPPTLNLHHCSEETAVDLVPLKAREKKLDFVLSNSFGFGGTNASIIFKKFA